MRRLLLSLTLILGLLPFRRAAALPPDAYVAVSIPAASLVSLDAVASFIRSNYSGTEAQLWALYSWEASYLKYNLQKRDVQLSITNADQLARWTIKHREGVCANFAAVFYAVARRLGVETYLVGGYCVSHNNVRDDGHMWCACIIDGRPYMFDPTWGGGYMLNNEQYVHRLSPDFFMVPPQKMVLSHMPEDPLFQLLDYPHKYDEIDNPGADRPVPVFFNWKDSLAAYNAQDSLAQLGGQLQRMRANGFANDWIEREILRLQHNYEARLLNQMVDDFNACVEVYQHLYALATGKGTSLANDDAHGVLANLHSRLDALSARLDEIEFSSGELSSGAAHVQQQVQQLLTASQQLADHF